MMNVKINDIFSILIKELNDCMSKLLQLTILSAESLENSMKESISKFQLVSISDVQNIKSKQAITLSTSMKSIQSLENNNDLKIERNEIVDTPSLYSWHFSEYPKSNENNDNITNVPYQKNEIHSFNTHSKNQLQKGCKESKSGLNKFACEQCNHTSADKSNLRKHVKVVHENIRNFECEECQRSFSIKTNLKDHMDRVHKAWAYFYNVLKQHKTKPSWQSFCTKMPFNL